MKKLSVKESTSVFGRPSECGDRRRTRGEGGLRRAEEDPFHRERNVYEDPPPEASSQHAAIASRRDHQALIHARVFPKLTVLQFRPAARKLTACGPSRARLSSVLSDAVTDADSGIDGARNDAKGTDIRRQAGTASQTKIPGSMMLAGRCGTAVLP
ncbi:hypothetical protein CGCF415_v015558 [Colletotrichum fructicola]|nr:hypothetical protein CGCFRS4_v015582 [Colletotrichum fructicola]KAF4884745.1 hypothetical protein CGCF415_v015558 [Colletotrichum fructicola]